MPACLNPNCDSCPIRQTSAFCNLPAKAQDIFEANSLSMEYPRGAVLFREGDRSSAILTSLLRPCEGLGRAPGRAAL